MTQFIIRPQDEDRTRALSAAGAPSLLARTLGARGMTMEEWQGLVLKDLLPWQDLKGIHHAARLLADAIAAQQKIVIIADYDADGATACAVGLRALRGMGAVVDYFVPNRLTLGYGLTPEVVALARHKNPDLLITVDNGIASVEGVDAAQALGIPVIITDHHLPGDELPQAAAIVNPNQPGCTFASKHLAGVGVMFYVMLALRAELRQRLIGVRPHSGSDPKPAAATSHSANYHLGQLLDLVALGTVADVVRLDRNNRLLVREGLKRIAAGRAQPGINALYQVAERDFKRTRSTDLGFVLGPRLNAAGRMEDMRHGIECLATDNPAQALEHARRLEAFNRERRTVEVTMQESALEQLTAIEVGPRYTLCLYDPSWHPGVVGILASRIKDRHNRPVITFAAGTSEGEIRGSGRSITGFHLRDALDQITKQYPNLILRFGGHAAAAGLTLRTENLARFEAAFEAVARQWLTPADLALQIEYDGEAGADDLTLPIAEQLSAQVWGQGFPEPLLGGVFTVVEQRVVGERHLKLKLMQDEKPFDAILFGHAELLPKTIYALYRLGVNEWNGSRNLQLEVRHWRV
jgi:single-stranded-DNA-specific exonuclease